ncbi:MAG: hypothetical protein K5839_01275, partial [Treponemataceae bacterium]|nr:hypothetical protein [Treponemataceae bacterium]
MKKQLKIFRWLPLLALLPILVFSCSALIDFGQTAKFSLSLVQSRSATNSSFSFSTAGYTYTLTATGSTGTTSTIFSGVSYSDLSESFNISPDTYTFNLTAYLDSVAAFTGTLSNVTVQGSSNNLYFYMTICEGFAAQATVVLELPDSGVYSVKAGVASIPLADVDECDYISATELDIDDTTDPSTVTYTASTFYSGRAQFVIFYLYDINGALIARIPESIITIPGTNSSSTISQDDYNLYAQVEYELRIDGTPSKTYYLTGEEFDPTGITVYCDGDDGSSFEVASTFYTTNFEDLVGCDQTVTFSFRGFTGDMATQIHRATYELTEEPVISSHTSWAFPGTDEIPAVFYEFGDYPQTAKADDITVSSGTA